MGKNQMIHSALSMMKSVVKFGAYRPQCWSINEKRHVAYNSHSRTCSWKIKMTVFELEGDDSILSDHLVYANAVRGTIVGQKGFPLEKAAIGWLGPLGKGVSKKWKDYFKFTYVRNPYERLVSTYEHKYHVNDAGYYKDYLFGYIEKDKGFDAFIRKVCRIPWFFLEEHLAMQYPNTFHHGKPVVDYIGRVEELDDTFPKLIEKYHLGKMFERKSYTPAKKKWMDYYTLETAQMVYRKYRKDFEAFGYEEEYVKLMNYLRKKKDGI